MVNFKNLKAGDRVMYDMYNTKEPVLCTVTHVFDGELIVLQDEEGETAWSGNMQRVFPVNEKQEAGTQ